MILTVKSKYLLISLIIFPFFVFGLVRLCQLYLYPYLDSRQLNSQAYAEEIMSKRGNYGKTENKVVWNSKRLKINPPPALREAGKLARKVLSADPNTWIDINLSSQNVCLFHPGGTNCFLVSTGLPSTPTPTGTFYIWIKLSSTLMSGPGYYLPNVPWTMYFYRGYGIHGTYWHSNFGQPMSHGCVNMKTSEAQFVFERVSVGTRVVVHY